MKTMQVAAILARFIPPMFVAGTFLFLSAYHEMTITHIVIHIDFWTTLVVVVGEQVYRAIVTREENIENLNMSARERIAFEGHPRHQAVNAIIQVIRPMCELLAEIENALITSILERYDVAMSYVNSPKYRRSMPFYKLLKWIFLYH